MYEIKFDGYRLLTRISGKKINLFTRNGHDWNHKLPSLVCALRDLNLKPGWLDGETVVLDDQGYQVFKRSKAHLIKIEPIALFTTCLICPTTMGKTYARCR